MPMCGIVGYIGKQKALPVILEGLRRLEYRGYDSAGVALFEKDGIEIVREEGKLERLKSKLLRRSFKGHLGMGHTRWATHGKPSERNAHPHQVGRVVVVHNGIIENYAELKKNLPRRGAELKSETDTEIVCHLMNRFLGQGLSFKAALQKTLGQIVGTYALVLLDAEDPDRFYVAKKGSPLVAGVGEGEMLVASDIPALLPFTRRVVFFEDGEMAECEATRITFYNAAGKIIAKKPKEISWTAQMAEKGGYKHYMLKEIMEQPQAVAQALMGRLEKGSSVYLDELEGFLSKNTIKNFSQVYIIACGTSWHAALVGKYYFENMCGLSVQVDTASEFRYRNPILDRKTLLIVISQSGETADTLACVVEAKKKGSKVLAICNVIDSSIARASDRTLYTQAGPEIGVASTKAFTTQLLVLLLLAFFMGKKTGRLSSSVLQKNGKALRKLPALMEKILGRKKEILNIAERYYSARDFYFMARGVSFPIALEGALKLKEISYIHAEAFSAGEMKHGPIALLEPGTPVVALAPEDSLFHKMLSNIEEVRARGASVITFTSDKAPLSGKSSPVFMVPDVEWWMTPLLLSLPLQLLAYYIADLRGADVDQPRNLAKSVTVE